MKTESMLVRSLARYVVSNTDEDREEFRRQCKELLMALDNSDVSLECTIMRTMHDLGIPANVLGYRYLKEAIAITVNDESAVNGITKIIYPAVAHKYNTTPSRVERAIRHAVEISFDRSDYDVFARYFGNTVSANKGKPTNSEYIAIVANNIRNNPNRI